MGSTAMKFFSLLPVRDEADIIDECLDHLLLWSDGIFVFDTGSVDETWEILCDRASRNKKIHLLAKDDVYYAEGLLRGYIFHKARKFMKDGDWFARVDADEFHLILPPDFVRLRMKKQETIAYHQYYNFELTRSEAERLSDPRLVRKERALPICERRRHYTISIYSEPRLCRYRSSMKWPPEVSFPYNAGFVARERLPILHYPNRDPMQMDRRCRLRSVMLADRENRLNWSNMDIHWTIQDWKKFIVEDDAPGLQYLRREAVCRK